MKQYTNLILDRDGVLNKLVVSKSSIKGRAPRELMELKFPFEAESIRREIDRYNSVVVTNQPDVESGAMSKEMALSIHDKVMNKYNIKNSLMCTHKFKLCDCRKPKTGMVEIASGLFRMKEEETIFIGDRWTDVLCGQNWGCDTLLLSPSLHESMKATEDGTQPPIELNPTYLAANWSQVFSILGWRAD